RAYLAGITDVMKLEFPPSMTGVLAAGLLLALIGNVLLGIAIWRSHTLPRWAGALWLVGSVIFYALGAVLGMATTGASLATQPVGAILMAISGAWIALAGLRTRNPNQMNAVPEGQ